MDLNTQDISDRIANGKVVTNTILLSNIIELTSSVISRLAGTDISDMINKAPVTKTVLATLVAQRLNELISNPTQSVLSRG